MVSSNEKRRLVEAYREPIDARAAIAKCAAGLLIVAGIALIGVSSGEGEPSATVSSRQVASGR